jgi:4-hydroxybenzoate polyprenyltransferase
MNPKLKAWLQLVRAPNLFTVPGDPLAGYLLASAGGARVSGALFWAIAASLCFYTYGLVLNDLADLAEDRRERPFRPLPSGAVSLRAAVEAEGILAVTAIFLSILAGGSALLIGVALLFAVTFYDGIGKKIPVFAQLNMGACRGLSVLMGAAAAGRMFAPKAIIAAAVITVYIAGVTSLSRYETKFPKLPPMIGSLIRALLFIQAAFCLWSNTGVAGMVAAFVLLALWPISRVVGKKFYAS